MEDDDKAIPFKYLLVGQTGSGRDSLAQRLAYGNLPHGAQNWLGIEFYSGNISVDGIEHPITTWSSRASEPRFFFMPPIFMRACFAVFIVYDVTDAKSFVRADEALKCTREQEDDNVVLVLVANKIDLPTRVISKEGGKKFASDNGLLYAEISALTGDGVPELADSVTREVLQRFNEGKLVHPPQGLPVTKAAPLGTQGCCY